jgi:hypothetical protein
MTTDALDRFIADHATGDSLRILVLTELAGVRHDLDLVRALVDSRQPSLGFLTVEAAKVQDDLIRAERRDRARHAREGVKPSGVVPAPGSVNAFSLLAEWNDLLADVERSITTRLLRAGVCHVTTRPMALESDDVETAADLRYLRVVDLVSVLSRDRDLRRVHNDLTDLRARVQRCIDGNQLKALPDPCPWCGHMTLVADLASGEIRCGRDPHTGDYAACVCSDSYCPCKTTPIRHRHTWHRDHQPHKATSWQGLRSAITHRPTQDPTTKD